MPFHYEDTKEYWDKIWDYGEHRSEHVVLDGSDGEEEFDQELRNRAVGRVVLDIGCGLGKFTLKIARKAKQVTGIDTSTIGLAQARMNMTRTGLRNADFRLADASRLPGSANSFDVVYSRRGPGSETLRTLSEAYRVLRKNGIFMQIEIGERDKQNLARIFGRGQMLHVKGQICDIKKKMLERVGFGRVMTRDYIGTEVFHGMSDLLVRLQSAPIIPSFDPRKDRKKLRRVQKECMTDRGIETPVHRVVLVARK
jgi:SAM-dependent methyltransferase